MTIALALILFGALMLYCGIKGRSLSAALMGRGEASAGGPLLGGS